MKIQGMSKKVGNFLGYQSWNKHEVCCERESGPGRAAKMKEKLLCVSFKLAVSFC